MSNLLVYTLILVSVISLGSCQKVLLSCGDEKCERPSNRASTTLKYTPDKPYKLQISAVNSEVEIFGATDDLFYIRHGRNYGFYPKTHLREKARGNFPHTIEIDLNNLKGINPQVRQQNFLFQFLSGEVAPQILESDNVTTDTINSATKTADKEEIKPMDSKQIPETTEKKQEAVQPPVPVENKPDKPDEPQFKVQEQQPKNVPAFIDRTPEVPDNFSMEEDDEDFDDNEDDEFEDDDEDLEDVEMNPIPEANDRAFVPPPMPATKTQANPDTKQPELMVIPPSKDTESKTTEYTKKDELSNEIPPQVQPKQTSFTEEILDFFDFSSETPEPTPQTAEEDFKVLRQNVPEFVPMKEEVVQEAKTIEMNRKPENPSDLISNQNQKMPEKMPEKYEEKVEEKVAEKVQDIVTEKIPEKLPEAVNEVSTPPQVIEQSKQMNDNIPEYKTDYYNASDSVQDNIPAKEVIENPTTQKNELEKPNIQQVAQKIPIVQDVIKEIVPEKSIVQEIVTEKPIVQEAVKETVIEKPTVQEVVKEIVTEKPTVQEAVKEIVTEKPFVQEVVQEIATEKPFVQEVVQEIATEKPFVQEVVQEIATEKPFVQEVVQEIATEKPFVQEVVQEIVTEKPFVQEVIQAIVTEKPFVQEVVQEIVTEKPFVQEVVQEIVTEKPFVQEVVQEIVTPKEEPANIVNDPEPVQDGPLSSSQEVFDTNEKATFDPPKYDPLPIMDLPTNTENQKYNSVPTPAPDAYQNEDMQIKPKPMFNSDPLLKRFDRGGVGSVIELVNNKPENSEQVFKAPETETNKIVEIPVHEEVDEEVMKEESGGFFGRALKKLKIFSGDDDSEQHFHKKEDHHNDHHHHEHSVESQNHLHSENAHDHSHNKNDHSYNTNDHSHHNHDHSHNNHDHSHEHSHTHESIFSRDAKEHQQKPSDVVVDSGFCEKVTAENCPTIGVPLSIYGTAQDNKGVNDYLKMVLVEAIESMDLIISLGLTALTVLIFTLGYYCIGKARREGPLVAKMNELERHLMAASKENLILKGDVSDTKQKLMSIEDNSFGSNDMVIALKQELEEGEQINIDLKDQVASLEKELENAAEAGLELNRMVSELLNNQSGSDQIISSVEDLQLQLNEQHATIESMNEALAAKSRENSEMQIQLSEISNKFQGEWQTFQQQIDAISLERSNVQIELENLKKDSDYQVNNLIVERNSEVTRLNQELTSYASRYEETKKCLIGVESKVLALEECLKALKTNSKEYKEIMDVAELKADLLAVTKEKSNINDKLQGEMDSRKLLEDRVKSVNDEMSSLKKEFSVAEKDKLEAQTRLEVLSTYFKEKETQLSQELSVKEARWMKQQGETTTTVEKVRALNDEIQALKSQNDSLRAEIEAQIATHRLQAQSLEGRAHEAWLGARQAERRLDESRAESAALRRRLTSIAENPAGASDLINGLPGLLNDSRIIPSPTRVESPNNNPLPSFIPPGMPGMPSMMGGLPPPPFGMPPPPFGMPGAPPPPFMPPFMTSEMRQPPLGRLMSPPPKRYTPHDERDSRYSPRNRGRYTPDSRYDDYSAFETETDFSPPPSPSPPPQRRGYNSPSERSKKSKGANNKNINNSSAGSDNSNRRKK